MKRLAIGLFGLGILAVIGFLLSDEVGSPIKFLVVAGTFVSGALVAALLSQGRPRGESEAADEVGSTNVE